MENFLLIFITIFCGLTKSTARPYFEVLMDRFEVIYNDNTHIDLTDVKLRKVNKTRSFVGEIIIKMPIGNDVIVDGQGYHKQGNEYRVRPYRFHPTPFCDFCSKDTYLYPDLARSSDFPEDIKANCPIKEGTYKLNGVNFPLENMPKTVFQSGEYAAELSFRRNDKLLFQFRVYVTVHNI